jgi:hypothetical protein
MTNHVRNYKINAYEMTTKGCEWGKEDTVIQSILLKIKLYGHSKTIEKSLHALKLLF